LSASKGWSLSSFNICEQPGDDNDSHEVDVNEELVYNQFESTVSKTEFDEYADLQMIYSQEEIKDKKGIENVDTYLLSRLTIDSISDITPIDDYFPDESLLSLSPMPWFANHINFLATGDLPAHWSTEDKGMFLNEEKNFYWDDSYLFKYCPNQIFQRCISDNKASNVIKLCHYKACESHFSSKKTTAKILQYEFYEPTMIKDSHVFCKACEKCQKSGLISKHKESLDNLLLTFGTYPSGNVHCAFHNL